MDGLAKDDGLVSKGVLVERERCAQVCIGMASYFRGTTAMALRDAAATILEGTSSGETRVHSPS